MSDHRRGFGKGPAAAGAAEHRTATVIRATGGKPYGTDEAIQCRHSFSSEQIEWFKAGSALNYVAKKG